MPLPPVKQVADSDWRKCEQARFPDALPFDIDHFTGLSEGSLFADEYAVLEQTPQVLEAAWTLPERQLQRVEIVAFLVSDMEEEFRDRLHSQFNRSECSLSIRNADLDRACLPQSKPTYIPIRALVCTPDPRIPPVNQAAARPLHLNLARSLAPRPPKHRHSIRALLPHARTVTTALAIIRSSSNLRLHSNISVNTPRMTSHSSSLLLSPSWLLLLRLSNSRLQRSCLLLAFTPRPSPRSTKRSRLAREAMSLAQCLLARLRIADRLALRRKVLRVSLTTISWTSSTLRKMGVREVTIFSRRSRSFPPR